MILRPYQEKIIVDAREAYRAGFRAPLVCSPTGSGKTVVTASITDGARLRRKRAWVIAHRKELILQPSKTLSWFDIPHGIVKAGYPLTPDAPVQVCSIQSLARRMESLPPPDFIIIDEAHHAVSGQYVRMIEANPQSLLLGLTATPERLDGRGLGDVFDSLVMGPRVIDLMDGGFLTFCRYFSTPVVADLAGMPRRGGDFVTAKLDAAMNRPAIIGNAVDHYRRICDGVPMIVFCVSIAHARAVALAYDAAGYRATWVDGTMKDDERDDRISGLGSGKWQIVTSCDLIGEGLDIPIVTAAQLLRPTDSLGLHLQQIGRVLRPAPGKDHAYVLDHVGNLRTHGFAEQNRDWKLDAPKRRGGIVTAEAISNCPQCYAAHQPAPCCPYCGYVYPPNPRSIEERDGTLEELTPTSEQVAREKRDRRREEGACRSFDDFLSLAKSRGYKGAYGWACHRARARGFHISK